jgi:hypothetical protein
VIPVAINTTAATRATRRAHRGEEDNGTVSEGSTEYYVRYQFRLSDGQWESVAFGPTDEADARRFYKRLSEEDSANISQPRLLRHTFVVVEPE